MPGPLVTLAIACIIGTVLVFVIVCGVPADDVENEIADGDPWLAAMARRALDRDQLGRD